MQFCIHKVDLQTIVKRITRLTLVVMYRPAFSIQLWGQTIQLKLCLFVLKYHVISTFIELLEAIIFISPLNEIVVGVHEQAVVRIQCTNGQLIDPLTGAVLLLWPMGVRYYLCRIRPYKNFVCQAGKQTFKDRHICTMVYSALVISATDTN